ncbi:uncharacterized protein LOC110709112 isoform X2 [Chenopodium quinoa]|uniref:uncharacterized protein LOC110709112 isoform X2 n=1 Tax=Chenopodium quinoa TaxID=63459 RepID=UPI000B7925C6|nr:uncharacterized protein LOC110709112 isoform X2 [Chenopodium quinoa]
MQAFGFCIALWLVGVLLMTSNSSSGMVFDSNTMTMTASRNLKEISYSFKFAQGISDGDVSLEDYRPVDPSPSRSKASVKHGPIQHGAPSHPYIPKPKPPPPAPSPFDHDGSP